MVKQWSLCMPALVFKKWSSPGCVGLACRFFATCHGRSKVCARIWPPDIVDKKVFSFFFSVPTGQCIFFWSVCLCVCFRGDRNTERHRQARTDTGRHGDHRGHFFDTAQAKTKRRPHVPHRGLRDHVFLFLRRPSLSEECHL